MYGRVIVSGHSTPRYRGLRMSADQYLRLAPDGFRYELVDGVVSISPSPSFRHQAIVAEVAYQIQAFLVDHAIGQVAVEVDQILEAPDVVVEVVSWIWIASGSILIEAHNAPAAVQSGRTSPSVGATCGGRRGRLLDRFAGRCRFTRGDIMSGQQTGAAQPLQCNAVRRRMAGWCSTACCSLMVRGA